MLIFSPLFVAEWMSDIVYWNHFQSLFFCISPPSLLFFLILLFNLLEAFDVDIPSLLLKKKNPLKS